MSWANTHMQVHTLQTIKTRCTHTILSFFIDLQVRLCCVCVSHLVPMCVTPPPPLQSSLLCCPSCKSTSFIATLHISFLCVCVCVCLCAVVPEAGVNQTGSVGGGSGGEDSVLPEGDPSPAEAAKR